MREEEEEEEEMDGMRMSWECAGGSWPTHRSWEEIEHGVCVHMWVCVCVSWNASWRKARHARAGWSTQSRQKTYSLSVNHMFVHPATHWFLTDGMSNTLQQSLPCLQERLTVCLSTFPRSRKMWLLSQTGLKKEWKFEHLQFYYKRANSIICWWRSCDVTESSKTDTK